MVWLHLGVPERSTETHARLLEVLGRSRALGFLGPGPVEDHVRHALTFVAPLGVRRTVIDLGSGGGVPGLVLAVALADLRATLVDAMAKRCRFLESSVRDLDIADRTQVVCGRAEDLARDPEYRGRFEAVVSRSFGPPAVTSECSVGFLAGTGGVILVSDPPDSEDSASRWPTAGLAPLGLFPSARVVTGGGTIQVLQSITSCPERFPRRVGVPAKRPLF
jgi:16S rRNA (guanine527-N7)-methyltransferase